MLLLIFTLPVFAKNTILILGDSLSAGHGIDISQGWVNLLREKLKTEKYDYDVINASISGDTTSNGLARLPDALNQYKPQITLIELGGNDGLRGLQLSTIQDNLRRMIELVKAVHSQVILLGVRIPPNYGPVYTQKFQAIYSALSHQENIALVPLFLKGVDDEPALMQSDGIHPTADGQGIMLNNVWPELRQSLRR